MPRSERLALVTISNKELEPVGQLEPRDEGPKARAEVSKEKKKEFLEKKAWEVATGPGKQFMMTGERVQKFDKSSYTVKVSSTSDFFSFRVIRM